MFEKEAEEYYYKTYPVTLNIGEEEREKEVTDIFIKGAEFGYKLAHEEMDYLNKHWGNGKDKANEWHYVKNGDLPPEDTKVIALMADKEICIAHFYRRNVWDKIGTVIAWKEIVLPKESE